MRTGHKRRAVIALVTIALLALVWSCTRMTEPAVPGAQGEPLRVAVGAEPDGAPVELDADLYLPTSGEPAPAVLLAHGFGGSKVDLRGEAQHLVDLGYVVLAYTARGFGDSGGRIHLNAPDFEVADATALIDLLAGRDDVMQDAAGDPRVAVVGASYGGALALMSAGADQRVDSVAAMITWHDLVDAFYPQHAQSTGSEPATGIPAESEDAPTPGPFAQLWASAFFTSAAFGSDPGLSLGDVAEGDDPRCGRFDPGVCALFLSAAQSGEANEEVLELLRAHSPAPTLSQVQAPTYLVQGMADSLFGIEHADDTARALTEAGAPVAVRWFNGGHDGDPGTGGQASGTGSAPPADGAPGADESTGAGSGDDAGGGSGAGSGGTSTTDGAQGSAAAEAGQAERDQQQAALGTWLDGTLRTPSSTLPLPGFTYALPLERGDDLARTLTLPDYVPGEDTEAAPGTRGSLELALRPARDPADGAPTLVNPPGGAPSAITVVPGAGGLLAGAPTYPLAALPGQHVAFDTEPVTDAMVVAGSPRVSVQLTSSAATSTLFVSLWQVQGPTANLPRRLVAPVRVETVPGQPVNVDLTLPAATWNLTEGSTWRVLITATDTAYRNDTQARIDQITLTDPVLRLPVVTGTAIAGPSLWDTETLAVGAAILLVLAGLALQAMRRRRTAPQEQPLEPVAAIPLVVSNLTKHFPDGHRAVDGVSWQAGRGQVVGLLGPNGAGKTTTLRMVTGLIHPDAGEIRVLGELVHPGAPVLARVGTLIEGPGFLPHLSGRDNLRAYWAATGRPDSEAHFDEALGVAALGNAIDRPVRAYSHGMKQRLGIAQAMLGLPEVLILDEPTNGLDPPQIAAMRPILQRYAATGRTVVISSHLLGEVELTCSHVVVMLAGQVVAAGSVQEVGVAQGRSLEEVFLSTIAGTAELDEQGRTDRLRQVRPR